jgi:hypothetical protein
MLKSREQIDEVLGFMYAQKDKARAIIFEEIKQDKHLLEVAGTDPELERMILKLREDKYLQMYPDYPRLPDGKQDISKPMYTYCSITFEGRLFWESGGYAKDLRRKKIMEFPQTYWWAVAIFAFLVGFFSDILKDLVKQKISPDTSLSQPKSPTSIDSLLNHKNEIDHQLSGAKDSVLSP